MDKTPGPVLKGIPILPVALALLTGISIGLAISIIADASRDRRIQELAAGAVVAVPCQDCADKHKDAVVADPVEPVPAPVTVDRSADVPG